MAGRTFPLRLEASSNTYKKISLICPKCGAYGVLNSHGKDIGDSETGIWFLNRSCANQGCFTHIFVVVTNSGELLASYPTLRIPFNASSIPDKIANSMSEAITCHSNKCYVAAGIMIRKSLELLCEHEKCTGKTLFAKLKDLETKITLPAALIEGMSDLRLLGNDCAHVEAQTYNEVGKEEIEISLAVTLEILKGVFQYESLISRLKSLKKLNG